MVLDRMDALSTAPIRPSWRARAWTQGAATGQSRTLSGAPRVCFRRCVRGSGRRTSTGQIGGRFLPPWGNDDNASTGLELHHSKGRNHRARRQRQRSGRHAHEVEGTETAHQNGFPVTSDTGKRQRAVIRSGVPQSRRSTATRFLHERCDTSASWLDGTSSTQAM